MFVHTTTIRVMYPDTDQMGFVHHSNYPKYCETARWEAMRAIGICYKDVEEQGIFMPVISMKFDFIKPAFYDDMITVKTLVSQSPSARMPFEFELYNESGELINSAKVTTAFLMKNTMKPCLPPSFLVERLAEFFKVAENAE